MLIAAVSILLGQIQIQDKIFAYNTSTERWWHATCVVCLSRWQRSRKKRCWWFANNLKIKLTQHSKLSAMIHVIFNLCRSDLLFIFYVFSFLAFTLRKILIPILSSRSVVNVFLLLLLLFSLIFSSSVVAHLSSGRFWSASAIPHSNHEEDAALMSIANCKKKFIGIKLVELRFQEIMRLVTSFMFIFCCAVWIQILIKLDDSIQLWLHQIQWNHNKSSAQKVQAPN